MKKLIMLLCLTFLSISSLATVLKKSQDYTAYRLTETGEFNFTVSQMQIVDCNGGRRFKSNSQKQGSFHVISVRYFPMTVRGCGDTPKKANIQSDSIVIDAEEGDIVLVPSDFRLY